MSPAADILIWGCFFQSSASILENNLCQLFRKSLCMEHVEHLNQMHDVLRINLYEITDSQENDIRCFGFAVFNIGYGLF